MFARRTGNHRGSVGRDARPGASRGRQAADSRDAETCTPARRLGLGLAVVAGVAMAQASPALAQNAAAIPVSVQVLEVPALWGGGSREAPRGWLAEASVGRLGTVAGRSMVVGGGMAAVVTETIEPDRLRVRLEYVAN